MARKRLILLGGILIGILILALPVSNLFIELKPTQNFVTVQAVGGILGGNVVCCLQLHKTIFSDFHSA